MCSLKRWTEELIRVCSLSVSQYLRQAAMTPFPCREYRLTFADYRRFAINRRYIAIRSPILAEFFRRRFLMNFLSEEW